MGASTMVKERFKSFLPSPEERKRQGIHFNKPVYKKILWYLWKLKYCTVDHLVALLSADKYAHDGSTGSITQLPFTTIQHNLLSLWENGFITKRVTTHKSRTRAGSDKDIWQLDERGASFIAESEGLFMEQIQYPKLPNTSKPHSGEPTGEYDFLKHNLLITDTIVSLHVFCVLSKKYSLVYFEPDKARKYSFSHNESHYFIRPDGLVILEGVDSDGNSSRINFFLEIDRATETLSDYTKKVKSYYALKESSKNSSFFEIIYQESLGNFQEQWLKQMRILTVTTSPKRASHMATSIYPLFNSGTGSKLFAFTSTDKFLPLAQRVEVLSQDGSRTYKKVQILFEQSSKIGSSIWRIASTKEPELSSIL